jgi:AcrR family transcriptional regulator
MTEYALAPTSNWDAANSPYRTPRVMLEQGMLRAYRVRSNGTMRHLELYPLGSTPREAAEWISDRIDMDGASVQAVARELHVSTPTIRRYLEGLELTEDIEDGGWDGLHFDSAGNPVFDTAWTESEEEAAELADTDEQVEELAPAPKPAPRTRSGRKCTVCAKAVTARNSAAKLRGAMGYDDMCATCYDDAGWENTHSDQGHGKGNRDAECPICQAEKAQADKDEALLAQNRARFTNTPQPTDAEVEATKAAIRAEMANVPGAQCEPTGTPADEVEEALEASVAARGGALAVCFCGGKGQHAPGTDGCANVAIPRRTRSH